MLFSFHGDFFSASSSLLFLSGFFQRTQYREKEQSETFLKSKLNIQKGKTEKKNHEKQQQREKDKKLNCAREIQLKNRDIIRNCYEDGTSVQGL